MSGEQRLRELNLAKSSASVVRGVSVVQAVKTSAAFFTFLRANLALSVPPSPLPEVILEPLVSRADRVAGTQLVADSIAQMGPRAARHILTHPAFLAVLATSWHFGLLLPLAIACLAALRRWNRGYSALAGGFARHTWLREGDVMLGARQGGVLVGVLVVSMFPRGRRRGSGLIRAWTTRTGHRGRGIGMALLGAGVRATKKRCGRDAEVGFARDHAHSAMLLPPMLTRGFRRDEARAAGALEGALEEWKGRRKAA